MPNETVRVRWNQLRAEFEIRLNSVDKKVRELIEVARSLKIELSHEYSLYLATKTNVETRLLYVQNNFNDLSEGDAMLIIDWYTRNNTRLLEIVFSGYSLLPVINSLSNALQELKAISNSPSFSEYSAIRNSEELLKNFEKDLNENKILTGNYIEALNKELAKQKENNQNLIKEFEQLRQKSLNDAAVINELKGRMEVELKEFDEKYRSNLGDYEILSQERIFREEAQQNMRDSKTWSYIIGGLAGVLIIVSWIFMCSCWFDYTCMCQKIDKACSITGSNIQFLFYYELIRPVLIRVFILSIVVLLLKFAIKNYNAIMHNSTINMNKANSLAALIRIIAGLPNDDKDSKNIILTSASKEIFLQHKTGYLSKDNAKVDLGLIEKIISIFRKE